MHFPALFLFIAFTTDVFTLAYVLAQNWKGPVNRSYIYFLFPMAVWIFIDFILVFFFGEEVMPYVGMKSFIWISLGILFLNFIYNLLSIKKDLMYYISGYSVLICVVINIFTDWIYLNGPLFLPVTLIVVVMPILYSFALVYKEITKLEPGVLFKKQLTLMLYGSISLLVVGVLFGIILPYVFNELTFFYITSSITGLQALFMLPALIKYNFLNIPIEQVTAELFKTSKNAEIVTDSFQTILQANNTALELFDTDLSELKKIKVSDLFHNYDFSKDYKNYDTKTTTEKQSDVSISQSSIKQNQFHIGKIIIIQDITDNKENERKLLESEERYRTLVEHSPNAILIHDTKQILFVNQAAVKIGQFNSKDDLIGKPPFSFLAPESLDGVLERTKKLYSGENIGLNEITLITPQGTLIYAEEMSAIVQYGGKDAVQSTLHDITDRKHSEKALKESEERYRMLVESSPLAIILRDDEKILYSNKTASDLIGLDRGKIIGKEPYFFIHPDDLNLVKERADNLNKGENLDVIEMRIVRSNGDIAFVEVSAGSVSFEGKKGIQGVFRDITERKIYEKALEESEERYRDLVENASDVIYRIDPITANYTYVNPMFVKISGYTEQELLKMNFNDLILPEFRKEASTFYKKQFKEKIPVTYFELPSISKDGSVHWMGQNVKIIKKEDGTIDNVSIIARDITDRKQIEDALKASEKSLQQAQHIANLGSWTENYQTNEVYWSKECKRLFGFDIDEEITNKKFWGKIHPEDVDWMKINWKNAEKTMNPYSGTFRILLEDGTIKYFSEKTEFLTDKEGKLRKVIGTVHDITQQHKANEEISKYHEQLRNLSARLQRLQEEERKRIAREIHDEFGQGLTAMKMELSWIKKKLISDDDEIHERLHSMNDLIDDSIFSVQSLSSQLRPSVLDQLGLPAAIEWQLKEFGNRTQVECILDIENQNINIDPDRSIAIFRIFQESLTNVARHSKADKVNVKLGKTNGKISLRVHDNGCGINTSNLKNDQSLGILGMKERASLWDGTIEIIGEINKGTTVLVEIPVATNEKVTGS